MLRLCNSNETFTLETCDNQMISCALLLIVAYFSNLKRASVLKLKKNILLCMVGN